MTCSTLLAAGAVLYYGAPIGSTSRAGTTKEGPSRWHGLLLPILSTAVPQLLRYDATDGIDATIITRGGNTVRLDDIELGTVPVVAVRHPFSFVYGGRSSDDLLEAWPHEEHTEELDADRSMTTTTWSDPVTGLRVRWEVIRYADFSALEWLLYFENTGRHARSGPVRAQHAGHKRKAFRNAGRRDRPVVDRELPLLQDRDWARFGDRRGRMVRKMACAL
ncbi:hypothetical protein AMK68_05280 [candidate division KD3-62 bacterium DG_56]|uniref:Uncharacterized protein n=1 Tax=candidate division KD3-62 bacterium DG_56 TaxID=1704032 RepID=A0A0S7XI34_9BACT|nr:MAG: hypothetical protein AMK68_05280 [candidate division KD3-62 bacterium DG_56]